MAEDTGLWIAVSRGHDSCGAVERGSATTPCALFFFRRQFLLPGVGPCSPPPNSAASLPPALAI